MILEKEKFTRCSPHADNKKKEKFLTPLSFLTPFGRVRGGGGDFLNKYRFSRTLAKMPSPE